MKNKEFKELLHSIDQAAAIRRKERKPSRVFHFEPIKAKQIRRKLGLSQAKFAAMLCVSIGTLRNWEQGRTYPEGAAVALLRIVELKPDVVLKALHVA